MTHLPHHRDVTHLRDVITINASRVQEQHTIEFVGVVTSLRAMQRLTVIATL